MGSYLETISAATEVAGPGRAVQLQLPVEDPIFAGNYPRYPVLPASLLVDLCCTLLNTHRKIDVQRDGWRLATSRFVDAIRPGDLITVAFSVRADRLDLRIDAPRGLAAELDFRLGVGSRAAPPAGSELEAAVFQPASSFLPQRYPLMVIDQVAIASSGQSGRARKLLSYGDYAFRHFSPEMTDGNEPTYPAGGIIEGIEQAAAAVLSRRWDMADRNHAIVVGGLRDMDFWGHAVPGEIIDFATDITMLTDRLAILSGEARAGDRPLVSIGRIHVLRMERSQ